MNIYQLVGQRLGQYELIEMLGRGGMGVVYRARQHTLNRIVAVKILTSALASDNEYITRFIREARTVGSLEHPHIVPVYDYGTENDITYVVMRFLTGGTLKERLRQRAGSSQPLPALSEISDLLYKIGSALDYAASESVVHRDIKSSNIMFDTHGNPFVVDFGIAKMLVSSSASLTGTGNALGTPTHMAPEQWDGRGITGATDQYAMGVVIYRLLTGYLPFPNTTPSELMFKHLNEAPMPPHMRRPEVPEAVSDVVLRALAKDPGDRFASVYACADSFAFAIEKSGVASERTTFFTFPVNNFSGPDSYFGGGSSPPVVPPKLTAPRLPTLLYRYRDMPVMWLMTLVIIILLAGLVYVLSNSSPVDDSITSGNEQTVEARIFASLTAEAVQTEIQRGIEATLQQTLTTEAQQTASLETVFPTNTLPPPIVTPTDTPVTPTDTLMAPVVLPTVTGQIVTELPTFPPPSTATPTMTATPTPSPTVVTPTPAPLVLVPINVQNVGQIRQLLVHQTPAVESVVERPVNSLAFSPSEPLVAFGGADDRIYLWDYARNAQRGVLIGHGDEIRSVSFSPNGLLLASGSWDNTVRLWDVQTMTEQGVLSGHNGWVYSVDFNPAGDLVASGSSDFSARLWDTFNLTERFVLPAGSDRVTGVTFNADGSLIAVGTQSGEIAIWELGATVTERPVSFEHDNWIEGLDFSPVNPILLASASRDTRVRVWNVIEGEEVRVFNHSSRVYSVAFSPDGRILAAANGSVIWLWDMESGEWLVELAGHEDWVTQVVWSLDGTLLASASGDGTVRLWGIAE